MTPTRPPGRPLRRLLPPLPPRLADFARRGFRLGEPTARKTLQRRAQSFLLGYAVARRTGIAPIGTKLAAVQPIDRGFAYEGAAFAAATADTLRARRIGDRGHSDLALLVDIAGERYVHLLHVGAGWVGLVAPMSYPVRNPVLDPLLRWLAVDGAAFARTFLRGNRWIDRMATRRPSGDPRQLPLYQGIGRCLWFVECGDPDGVSARIGRFPDRVHCELWAGVGLAACYAGGVTEDVLMRLYAAAGAHRPALAQGSAFAAGARVRSGYVPPHTETGVRLLAGVSAAEAGEWTRLALPSGGDSSIGAYLAWQSSIRRLAERTCQ